ncbi:MAG: hypothetical protein AAFR81_30250, partial [Chloroflexota bacterium]
MLMKMRMIGFRIMVDDLWEQLIPDELFAALEADEEIQRLWKQYDDEWRDLLPVGTRVILVEARNHVSYVSVGEWGTVTEHDDPHGIFASKGRGLGIKWDSGLTGFINPLLVWSEDDYMVSKRQLWVTIVKMGGSSPRISIAGKRPDAERYDKVLSLPITITNGISYEPEVFVSGSELLEDEAKVVITRLLESPIWRARLVGKYIKMPHDDYWNAIFIVDNHDEDLGVLNLRYADGNIEIEIRDNFPAFLPLSRDE